MSPTTIVLITGANTGLGFETVKSLCQSSIPYTILLSGRSIDHANAAALEAENQFPESPSIIKAIQIDIEDDDSISRARQTVEIEHGHLDVLINNAGAQFDQQASQGKSSLREIWNKSWSLNTTSTQIFTGAFIPLLLQSTNPRLLFITSGTSTLAESSNTSLAVNNSPAIGWPKQGFSIAAYRSSKTGMNMMMREWVRLLKGDGVKIWAVSPGFLATGLGENKEMLKKMGAEDPEVGGRFVRDVIEGKRDSDVGLVVRKNGIQPW